MKAVLGWLCDPYFHMVLLVLVLVRLGMGLGTQEAKEITAQGSECRLCQQVHEANQICPPRVVQAPAMSLTQ
jgi:hypothetical protein